jgi:hypothetical protein
MTYPFSNDTFEMNLPAQIQDLSFDEIDQVGGAYASLEELAEWNASFGKAFREVAGHPARAFSIAHHYVETMIWVALH